MSRIGKAPVTIAKGVDVTIKGSTITVKGPKGELEQVMDQCVTVKQEGDDLVFERESDHPDHRSKHGLYRALVANMIEGVSEGYKKQLELVGVGYRATASGTQLNLSLGFSHPIVLVLPSEIKVTAETEKGKNPIVTLESHDKQLVGQVASKIRSLRKPEPYKGKGVKYVGEYIRRKAGKSAAK
ncbi:MAG: 50S ribosomal protein L6 [Flavobacteriales bacterium]